MAKKVLVVIDPGHVGSTYNAGAVKGYYESAAVWKLSQYEKAALEKYGIKVVITKNNINDDIPLYNRGQIAVKNSKGYDAVVFESNHTNAANGNACGVTIIRSKHLDGSVTLANKIINSVVDAMKPVTGITYNRGVTTKTQSNGADWYGVIRGAVSGTTCESKGPVMYAYIVEHGFHDNLKECQFLAVDANLKKIAEAKAKVIAEYFRLSKTSGTSSGTTGASSCGSSGSGSTATKTVKATGVAQKRDTSLSGTYKVTAGDGLNVRNGAGTSEKVLVTIPKCTSVKCYGYYTTVSGVKWLYVQFIYQGVQYTGFCSSAWLKKV